MSKFTVFPGVESEDQAISITSLDIAIGFKAKTIYQITLNLHAAKKNYSKHTYSKQRIKG